MHALDGRAGSMAIHWQYGCSSASHEQPSAFPSHFPSCPPTLFPSAAHAGRQRDQQLAECQHQALPQVQQAGGEERRVGATCFMKWHLTMPGMWP